MNIEKAADAVVKLIDIAKQLKKGHKSKTVWLGVGVTLLGIGQAFLPEISNLVAGHSSTATTIIGVAILVLRTVTTKALGDK